MTKTANNPTPPLSQWRQVRNQAIQKLAAIGLSLSQITYLRLCDLYDDGYVVTHLYMDRFTFGHSIVYLDSNARDVLKMVHPQLSFIKSHVASAFGRRPDSYYPLSPRQIARILQSASSADKKTESVKSVVKKEFKGGLNGQ